MFDTTSLTIGVLPGDGAGPELVGETLKVLEAVGADATLVDIPALSLDPEAAFETIASCGLVLSGPLAGGLPQRWTNRLGLFAKVRKTEHFSVVDSIGSLALCDATSTSGDHVSQTVSVQPRDIRRLFVSALAWAARHGLGEVTHVSGPTPLPWLNSIQRDAFQAAVATQRGVRGAELELSDALAALIGGGTGPDLMVTPDGFGSVLADISTVLAGRASTTATAMLGSNVTIFGAEHSHVHAPVDRTRANPSALIRATAMLLRHAGRLELANMIDAAWGQTIADGVHTDDMAGASTTRNVSGRVFTQAVIARLGVRSNTTLLERGVSA
ncbi:MAG: isocitrate/isopropylmalate family dehydrogenase [Pseudomonadota bacterium]